MLACHSYISGAGVRDGFYRKAYISFFLVLLCLGDSGRCGYDGISRKAVAEISPCVVVAWLLPRDFGGSHDYVCRRPERICTSYCREQGKQLCGAGERAGDRFALYIAFGQLSGGILSRYGSSRGLYQPYPRITAGAGGGQLLLQPYRLHEPYLVRTGFPLLSVVFRRRQAGQLADGEP